MVNQSVLARFGGVNKFVYLTQITIKIEIFGEKDEFDLKPLCTLLNYFQSSMIFTTLEFEMPFVFSYWTRRAFGYNYKYITSISYSLSNHNKLVDNILNIMNETSKSSAAYLYDLSINYNKRSYQSLQMKRNEGKPNHTLKMFDPEGLTLDENDQFKVLT